MCVYSVASDSAIPLTVTYHAPLSMEFSKEEYWSRFTFNTPGDLPDPGIKPMSPESPASAGGVFITEPPGKPKACESSLNHWTAREFPRLNFFF